MVMNTGKNILTEAGLVEESSILMESMKDGASGEDAGSEAVLSPYSQTELECLAEDEEDTHGAKPEYRASIRHPLWMMAGASLCGPGHDLCEDAFQLQLTPEHGAVMALADGVSGGDFGALAASALVKFCSDLSFSRQYHPEKVEKWLLQADKYIADVITSAGGRRGAACMAAVWLGPEGKGCIAHVGDCRAYRVKADFTGQEDVLLGMERPNILLTPLTQDETYRTMGKAPPSGVSADNPARMMGMSLLETVHVQPFSLSEGEGVLLASDGLHGYADEARMAEIIQKYIGAGVDECVDALLEDVRAVSHDDIGVALLWRV